MFAKPPFTSSEALHLHSELFKGVGRGSSTLRSDASGPHKQLWSYLEPHHRQDWVQYIETLEFVVYSFISILGLACVGTRASVSGDSPVLSIKKGMLVLLPSHQRGHIEKIQRTFLLRKTVYHMSLGFPAYKKSWKVWKNRCEWSGYPYSFDTGVVVWVEASVEPVGSVKTMAQWWQSGRFLRYLWSFFMVLQCR